MSGEPTKSEPTTLGVAHSKYVEIGIGSLAGLVFGIVIMLVTNWWTSKAPYLRYTPSDTVSFQGDKNRFGLVTCVVTNDGTLQVEDVDLFLDLADCFFIEVKVTPEALQPVVKTENEPTVLALGFFDPKEQEKKKAEPPPRKGNHAHVTVKLLNPGESFQVVAMVGNPDKLPTRPDFTVRGKGVAGKNQPQAEKSPLEIAGFLALFVAMLSFCIWQLVESVKREIRRPTPPQKQS